MIKISLRRVVALFLILASVLGVVPAAFATDSITEPSENVDASEPTVETEATDAIEAEQEEIEGIGLTPEEYVAALAAMESPLNVSFSLHLNTIF